jgi:ABC-type phosphate/phosphonate transport system substrate-binding protein
MRIVLGVVVPSAGSGLGERIDAIAKWMSARIGVPIERRDAASYETLAADVREGRTDLAWLPPIVYLRLGSLVTPLGSMVRRGAVAYEAALIVPSSSKIRTIDALRGVRAGWVDRWSAAGFVLPRVKLALSGIDPRTLFRTETFHGSHRSLVKALMQGACDVAGTHAQADRDGRITSGAWSQVPGADVRVLATFGSIPPDVIAVRTAVAHHISGTAFAAFKDACANDMTREHIREVFGGEDVTEGLAPGYDSLQKALEMATGRGIFD